MIPKDADVWELLGLIEPRRAWVLMRYYGLASGRPWPLRQIGQRLGIGESRACQLRRLGLQDLRAIGAQMVRVE